MISKEKFIDYVKGMLEKDGNIDKLKKHMLGYKVASFALLILGLLLIVFAKLFSDLFGQGWVVFLICLSVFGGALLAVVALDKFGLILQIEKQYRKKYRLKIIKYLLKGYKNSFSTKKLAVPEKILRDSQIAGKMDFVKTSDFLLINIPKNDGKKSNTDLILSDIEAYKRESDVDGRPCDFKIYKGMFGYAKFSHKFNCVISINSAYDKYGLKMEKVVLEDIEFDENFTVKSNNQIEARYILTPDMMSKLNEFKKKVNNIQIVFADDYLYIGAMNVNLFELHMFKGNDENIFENLYDEISIILSLVEEIKKNDKVFKIEG